MYKKREVITQNPLSPALHARTQKWQNRHICYTCGAFFALLLLAKKNEMTLFGCQILGLNLGYCQLMDLDITNSNCPTG